MPNLSDLLVSGVQTSSQNAGNELVSGIKTGGALAESIQNVQNQRAQIEQKKQDLQLQKFEKVGNLYEIASKMPEGPAKKAFQGSYIPSTIGALGIDKYIHPVVQEMFSKETHLAAFINEKIRAGDMTIADLTNPEKIAATSEGLKQFGDQKQIAATIDDHLGKFEEASKFALSEEGKLARSKMLSGVRGAQVETSKDTQSARAVKDITNDHALSNLTQQFNNIGKGMNLLNNNPTVTTVNEVAQDFAQALSGKGVSSDFRIKEISTPTLEGQRAKLASFLSSNPNQPAPPEVVKFWKDMGTRLDGAYHGQIGARAKTLSQEAKTVYKNNPNAVEAIENIAHTYQTGTWSGGAGRYPVGKTFTDAETAKTFYTQHPEFQNKLTKKMKQDLGL